MTNITIQNSTLNLKLVKFNNEERQAVNARDLHKFLENKQVFSTWIKGRIQKYGFVENEDFILEKSFSQNYETSQPNGNFTANRRGRPTLDYFVSWEMAKDLAMDDLTKCLILRRKKCKNFPRENA